MNFKNTKNFLSIITGFSLFKKQANYIKNDFSGMYQDIHANKRLNKPEISIDTWNAVIINEGVTEKAIRTQYQGRRIIALILLAGVFICLYVTIVDAVYITGSAVSLVLLVLYFKNVFRLFQIRQRDLCKVRHYLAAAKKSFQELLPVPLPKNWVIMNEGRAQ